MTDFPQCNPAEARDESVVGAEVDGGSDAAVLRAADDGRGYERVAEYGGALRIAAAPPWESMTLGEA